MKLSEAILCVVDVETTGLDPEVDKVVECATVFIRGGEVEWQDAYSELFNPGISIPPAASAVHHLTDEHVATKPRFAESAMILPGMASVFVAHNAAFDSKFIPQISNKPMLCTMRIAKKIWPELDGYGNQFLRYHHKLPIPQMVQDMGMHRALPDAIVTAFLLVKELREMQADLLESSIESVCDWLAKPILLHRCGFGKYGPKDGKPGFLWKDVPKDYLRWMLNNMSDMDEDMRFTAQHYYRS